MSEILTDEARAAIRALAEAATPGPWRWVQEVHHGPACYLYGVGMRGHIAADLNGFDNADFIAHARTDVTALLDDGDALREQVARLTQERDAERRLRIEDATGKIDAERERDTERAARLAAEEKLAEAEHVLDNIREFPCQSCGCKLWEHRMLSQEDACLCGACTAYVPRAALRRQETPR